MKQLCAGDHVIFNCLGTTKSQAGSAVSPCVCDVCHGLFRVVLDGRRRYCGKEGVDTVGRSRYCGKERILWEGEDTVGRTGYCGKERILWEEEGIVGRRGYCGKERILWEGEDTVGRKERRGL